MMEPINRQRGYDMQTLELEILNWIQSHLRCGILDAAMPAVSWICNHGEVWILLAAVLLAIPKTRKAGACLACGLAVDLLLCNLWLKPWIGRVRPFAVNPDVKLLIVPPTDASFPSGHTCAAFAAASAWWRTLPRRWMRWTGLVLAVCMGLSRLYVGVHYPSDVIAGALVGLFCGWAAWKLLQLWEERRGSRLR